MEYRVAATVDEALDLLGRTGGARPVAGGTDLAVVLADGARFKGSIDMERKPELPGRIAAPER